MISNALSPGASNNNEPDNSARTQKKVSINTSSQHGNDTEKVAETEHKRMRDKFSWQHVGENLDDRDMVASRPGAFQFETRV